MSKSSHSKSAASKALSGKSSSSVQKQAEDDVRAAYAKKYGIDLGEGTLDLPGGAKVKVDGISTDGKTVVEIFVRQGSMKSGQRRKVAMDVLKLITLKQSGQGISKHQIVVADREVEAELTSGKSWLAEAIESSGIEVVRVELTSEQNRKILDAQKKQRMVIAPD